ncbi:MAG: fatty acid desaturase [Myxococcales bacterium]|nr:fatty acid desaturase [Myxococcales bacterium]
MQRLRAVAADRPLLFFVGYFVATTALYQTALHAPWRTPLVAPHFAIEQYIPFLPWTAWIYATYFALMPAWLWVTRRAPTEIRASARLGAALVVLLTLLLNIAVPTSTAASGQPSATELAGTLLSFIVSADTPLAAAPSGHVALPVALAVLARRSGLLTAMRVFAVWAVLLFIAVLTTRQHVALDALLGVVWGAGAALVSWRLCLRGERRSAIAWPSVLALARELVLCAAALWLALLWWSPVACVLAFCFIAVRQHAMFILYHDAVHGLIARNRRLNDLIVNLAVGVPMLLPVHTYRRFHISHHATLGTENDTERVLLYRWQPWNYEPLGTWPLIRQLLGDLLLVNQLRMGWALLTELRKPDSLLRLPPSKPFVETFVMQGLLLAGVVWALLAAPEATLKIIALWVGPLLTLTQAIQKVRSFAEHGPLPGPELTYSWRPGWLGRQLLWPYHISYHKEHHERPNVPWFELPRQFAGRDGRQSRELWSLLWRRE